METILCLGDSNTYGYDPRGFFGGRYASPWPALLEENTGWPVRNLGLNGRKIPAAGGGIQRLDQQIAGLLPAGRLAVMLGTNDSKARNWDPEAFPREWEQFAGTYLTLPNRPAVIGMLPPRAFSVNGEPVAYSVDAAVLRDGVCPGVRAAAARLGIPVIDLYALTAYHPEWFQDGVHPNARGCHEMAACIAGFLNAENIL